MDVSASIYNALPQAYSTSGTRSARSLLKPDSSLESGNSLRAVASSLRQQAGITDFSPPPANQQGFASLGPSFSSLRLSPQQLAAAKDTGNEPATYEKLLEIQDEISLRRAELAEAAELRTQARQQAAAELEISQARVQSFREKAVFSSELPIDTVMLSGETREQENRPEPAPLLGQNDSTQSVTEGSETDKPYPPAAGEARMFAADVPEPTKKAAQENNDSVTDQRQRIQQLFNTDQSRQNSGNSISIYA